MSSFSDIGIPKKGSFSLFAHISGLECHARTVYEQDLEEIVVTATKEDTIEPGTEKLSLTADPREDGLVKSRTGDTTTETTYKDWYKNVYVPTPKEVLA